MKTLLKISAFIGLGLFLPWLHYQLSGGETLSHFVLLFFVVNAIVLVHLFDWYFRDNGGYEVLVNKKLVTALVWVSMPILLHFASHHLRNTAGSTLMADFLHGVRYWSFLLFFIAFGLTEYKDYRRFCNRSLEI